METTNLALRDIERYLQTTGKRGAMVLSLLGRLNSHFAAIVETEVGRELLSLDIARTEELLIKIYEETATEEEKAEFRYLKKIRLPRQIELIKTYLDKLKEVKEKALNAV